MNENTKKSGSSKAKPEKKSAVAGKSDSNKAKPAKKVADVKSENTGGAKQSSAPGITESPAAKALALFNKHKKTAATILTYLIPALIFVYAAGTVIYFITSAYRAEFHADCTDTIIWANASIEGDAVYDKDFKYACFLPFGMNVIMQPLIEIFGLTMKVHIIGMMAFFVLLVTFFCLMLKEMHWDIRSIFIACAVFLSMTVSSQKLREIFWQHTIYYTLGILFIVIGLYMYFHLVNLSEKIKSLNPEDKKIKTTFIRCIITFILLAVFIMFTATDGISALSIFALPFIAALFAEYFVNSENSIANKKALKTISMVGIFGIMVICGMKLNEHWVGDLSAGYQDAYSTFSPIDNWKDNILKFPIAWMKLNGVKDCANMTNSEGKGVLLSDPEGIENLLYILTSLILLAMPIIATCFYQKYKDSKDGHMIRIFVWIHWACTAIVLMGYFFGQLSGADWRLTPILGTSLILSIFFVHWAVNTKTSVQRLAVLLAMPVLMVSLLNLKAVHKIEKDYHKANNLYGLTEFLEDEGLTYGYATFWNANSITLLSDSKVKVRDVNVNEGGVTKRIYQSSARWYEDQKGQEEYFLLLSPHEYQTLVDIQSPIITEKSKELITLVNNTEYRVFVFDHNIF